ncbi:uncharacterized protein LOC121383914 [Gigantopelta aegis]|uniref:uncharacterized protein LOC121383914 n=1 Tax=Gigantopelta aegis TaxID=1735272 RepID=UPI001B88B59E|nr:uncharacterized protein LOC121383914 [Gigantopelta aegis]
MEMIDAIPYRCPWCGGDRTFFSLTQLKTHLSEEHAYLSGSRSRIKVFKNIPSRPKNRSSALLQSLNEDSLRLEKQLRDAKDSEMNNKVQTYKPYQEFTAPSSFVPTSSSPVYVPVLPFHDSHIKKSLDSLSEKLCVSRSGQWRSEDMLYKTGNVLSGLQTSADFHHVEQRHQADELVARLAAKEEELTILHHDFDRLREEKSEVNVNKPESDEKKMVEKSVQFNHERDTKESQLNRKYDHVGNIQLQDMEKVMGNPDSEDTSCWYMYRGKQNSATDPQRQGQEPERMNSQVMQTQNHALRKLQNKDRQLAKARVRLEKLEQDREVLLHLMKELLSKEHADNKQLRKELRIKEEELRRLNSEINSAKVNHKELLVETYELYKEADRNLVKLREMLTLKDSQLKVTNEKLVQFESSNGQLKFECQTREQQAGEIAAVMRQTLRNLQDQLTSVHSKLTAETRSKVQLSADLAAIEEELRQKGKTEAELTQELTAKEQELTEAKRSLASLQCFLDVATRKETMAREELKTFISELIDRVERAERETRTLKKSLASRRDRATDDSLQDSVIGNIPVTVYQNLTQSGLSQSGLSARLSTAQSGDENVANPVQTWTSTSGGDQRTMSAEEHYGKETYERSVSGVQSTTMMPSDHTAIVSGAPQFVEEQRTDVKTSVIQNNRSEYPDIRRSNEQLKINNDGSFVRKDRPNNDGPFERNDKAMNDETFGRDHDHKPCSSPSRSDISPKCHSCKAVEATSNAPGMVSCVSCSRTVSHSTYDKAGLSTHLHLSPSGQGMSSGDENHAVSATDCGDQIPRYPQTETDHMHHLLHQSTNNRLAVCQEKDQMCKNNAARHHRLSDAHPGGSSALSVYWNNVQPQCHTPWSSSPYRDVQNNVQTQCHTPRSSSPYGDVQNNVQPQCHTPRSSRPYGDVQNNVQSQSHASRSSRPYGDGHQPGTCESRHSFLSPQASSTPYCRYFPRQRLPDDVSHPRFHVEEPDMLTESFSPVYNRASATRLSQPLSSKSLPYAPNDLDSDYSDYFPLPKSTSYQSKRVNREGNIPDQVCSPLRQNRSFSQSGNTDQYLSETLPQDRMIATNERTYLANQNSSTRQNHPRLNGQNPYEQKQYVRSRGVTAADPDYEQYWRERYPQFERWPLGGESNQSARLLQNSSRDLHNISPFHCGSKMDERFAPRTWQSVDSLDDHITFSTRPRTHGDQMNLSSKRNGIVSDFDSDGEVSGSLWAGGRDFSDSLQLSVDEDGIMWGDVSDDLYGLSPPESEMVADVGSSLQSGSTPLHRGASGDDWPSADVDHLMRTTRRSSDTGSWPFLDEVREEDEDSALPRARQKVKDEESVRDKLMKFLDDHSTAAADGKRKGMPHREETSYLNSRYNNHRPDLRKMENEKPCSKSETTTSDLSKAGRQQHMKVSSVVNPVVKVSAETMDAQTTASKLASEYGQIYTTDPKTSSEPSSSSYTPVKNSSQQRKGNVVHSYSVTDDSSVVEKYGGREKSVAGLNNVKTSDDKTSSGADTNSLRRGTYPGLITGNEQHMRLTETPVGFDTGTNNQRLMKNSDKSDIKALETSNVIQIDVPQICNREKYNVALSEKDDFPVPENKASSNPMIRSSVSDPDPDVLKTNENQLKEIRKTGGEDLSRVSEVIDQKVPGDTSNNENMISKSDDDPLFTNTAQISKCDDASVQEALVYSTTQCEMVHEPAESADQKPASENIDHHGIAPLTPAQRGDNTQASTVVSSDDDTSGQVNKEESTDLESDLESVSSPYKLQNVNGKSRRIKKEESTDFDIESDLEKVMTHKLAARGTLSVRNKSRRKKEIALKHLHQRKTSAGNLKIPPSTGDESSECLTDTSKSSRVQEEARWRRVALFSVFKFLDTKTLSQVAGVNREWKKVSRHPSLWKRVELKSDRISSLYLSTISQWCTQLESLTLEGLQGRRRCPDESDEDYRRKTKGCLEPGMEDLLKVCQDSLTSLHIIDCGNLLTDKSLWLTSCYSCISVAHELLQLSKCLFQISVARQLLQLYKCLFQISVARQLLQLYKCLFQISVARQLLQLYKCLFEISVARQLLQLYKCLFEISVARQLLQLYKCLFQISVARSGHSLWVIA